VQEDLHRLGHNWMPGEAKNPEEILVDVLVVPDVAEPGMKLWIVAPDGQGLTIIVPEGLTPGSLMEMHKDPVSGKWSGIGKPLSGGRRRKPFQFPEEQLLPTLEPPHEVEYEYPDQEDCMEQEESLDEKADVSALAAAEAKPSDDLQPRMVQPHEVQRAFAEFEGAMASHELDTQMISPCPVVATQMISPCPIGAVYASPAMQIQNFDGLPSHVVFAPPQQQVRSYVPPASTSNLMYDRQATDRSPSYAPNAMLMHRASCHPLTGVAQEVPPLPIMQARGGGSVSTAGSNFHNVRVRAPSSFVAVPPRMRMASPVLPQPMVMVHNESPGATHSACYFPAAGQQEVLVSGQHSPIPEFPVVAV